jgi:hypothetical protein
MLSDLPLTPKYPLASMSEDIFSFFKNRPAQAYRLSAPHNHLPCSQYFLVNGSSHSQQQFFSFSEGLEITYRSFGV